jgi:subtilisin family serine protease
MSHHQEEEASIGLPLVKVHQVANTAAQQDAIAQQDEYRWAKRILGVPAAWSQTRGEGVKVAVLDTGVDPDHPDLASGIVAMEDFTGDGIEDVNGHGTHCAGIIGARENNLGFIGVAPACDLLIGKVLGNNGSGSWSGIAAGVNWAVDQGADIISMSLGGGSSSHELFVAIHNALMLGKFVICAAGNEGSLMTNSIGYPGRYGGVITVASHDHNGNRSGFSSKGGEIDVMAPGSNIWSTYKEGSYAELSGTSMATPFVAGLAALVTAKHINQGGGTPLRNTEDLKNHLLWMAAHPGYHDNETGYGPLLPFKYF